MVPFRLHYTLTRRQRLAAELYPWLPCLAASLGFTLGDAFLSAVVSRWFLPLLLLPPLVCRNFLAFLFELATHPGLPVEVEVTADALGVRVDGHQRWLPLEGIIQVYPSDDHATWTVLHVNGSVLTIPAAAIAADQLDYLKGFARRAAAERKAAAL